MVKVVRVFLFAIVHSEGHGGFIAQAVSCSVCHLPHFLPSLPTAQVFFSDSIEVALGHFLECQSFLILLTD